MHWLRRPGPLLCLLATAQAEHLDKNADQNLPKSCELYGYTSKSPRQPFSDGVHKLSFMRPEENCRTFKSPEVEDAIRETADFITDPDLARLFTNAFPNTLDTTIAWTGSSADNPEEELAFVITGDIPAMWLRDSANQLHSYTSLLQPSSEPDSLASLFRGAINLHARYLAMNPYCQAFQPPQESGRGPERNWAYNGQYKVTPEYESSEVFECKWELDSHAAYLQLCDSYFKRTADLGFFNHTKGGKSKWTETVERILNVVQNMTEQTTYNTDGTQRHSEYVFTEAMNGGIGSPVRNGTGLIRSFFRPSDDATMYQFFVPGNMQFAVYLNSTAEIADGIGEEELAERMRAKAKSVREGVEKFGVVKTEEHGEVYAYEVDGYGGVNLMDDANSPSLLSSAYFGYTSLQDPIYQNTRARILSTWNPYWAHGPVLSTIGSPHSGVVNGWPMAAIMRILTSEDDEEISQQLYQLVSSTDGLGLIHESVHAHNQSQWTRSWFAWANGLFGQAVLELKDRKPGVLKMSFQDGERWGGKGEVGDLEYVPKVRGGTEVGKVERPVISSVPARNGHEDGHHSGEHDKEDHDDGDHDDMEEEANVHGHAEMGSLRLEESSMTWFWFIVGVLVVGSGILIVQNAVSKRTSWVENAFHRNVWYGSP